MDVATAGERFNRCLPAGEHLVALAGIAADANWPADMIEHDLRFWECTGKRGQFVDLRVVEPGIVTEAEPCSGPRSPRERPRPREGPGEGYRPDCARVRHDPRRCCGGCRGSDRRQP